MLHPKRSKYRKHQKGRVKGLVNLRKTSNVYRRTGAIQSNQNRLTCGRYKIISLSVARLRATTIEAIRRVITRKLKRSGQVLVKVHPSQSVTEKPLEVRMGKGKGAVSYWICRIKKGQVLYEIDGVELARAKAAWLLANAKFPIKTKFLACTHDPSVSLST